MRERGLPRPVLVGGAAAEFWSTSALTTGDFDVCTPVPPELEEVMRQFGFIRPSGPGKLLKGWLHPDLKPGFEVVVADVPMDGNVDAAHIRLVRAITFIANANPRVRCRVDGFQPTCHHDKPGTPPSRASLRSAGGPTSRESWPGAR